MARYLISFTERKKDGTLKKKQGVIVNKFRRLLKKQGIVWVEKTFQANLDLLQLPMWMHVIDNRVRPEYGLYGPTGILCKNNDPNIMIEFTFDTSLE